ncbi:urotensin 2 [Phyllostomus discolor]|uniref:Urotensin-2 n=1 Tax=Phyllostomus discolor TaxID=89673 RepID=A0A834AH07_9CHIR|nr:urotensin 2 [Phyllostomus discolor]
MYRLASCYLLLMGCLRSLSALPVPDSRDEPLPFPAPDGGVRPALDKADGASLLRGLLEALGAETGDGLGRADPGTDTSNPRGITGKALSGQGPSVLLNHLPARSRKHSQRGPPSECFWKYCV